MADVVVRKSKIHGRGVFAARNFKKGEVVLKWQPEKIISLAEVKKLSAAEKEYINKWRGNKYALMAEPEKLINHSCDFNTKVKNYCDVAIRSIKKGEEITGDYSGEYGEDSKIECQCGAKNCKKFIK